MKLKLCVSCSLSLTKKKDEKKDDQNKKKSKKKEEAHFDHTQKLPKIIIVSS